MASLAEIRNGLYSETYFSIFTAVHPSGASAASVAFFLHEVNTNEIEIRRTKNFLKDKLVAVILGWLCCYYVKLHHFNQ